MFTVEEIATLVDAIEEAGLKSVRFSPGCGLSGEVYFCQLRLNRIIETRKLMMLALSGQPSASIHECFDTLRSGYFSTTLSGIRMTIG